MSIEGQGHFFTIYFPGFVCFVLYLDKISGERLQDHWSSGFMVWFKKMVGSAQYILLFVNVVPKPIFGVFCSVVPCPSVVKIQS